MKQFYFTFGSGSPLSRYYVRIDADDENQARCRMICLFDRHWSSVYSEEEFSKSNMPNYLSPLNYYKQAGLQLCTKHEQVPLEIFNRAYPWE